MTEESAAQSQPDTGGPNEISDAALLEEALQEAVGAHDAGLLAAPFGVDDVALARARRRALRADIRRELAKGQPDQDNA